MSKAIAAQEYVGEISDLKGLIVEVQILGDKPDLKELLVVEDHPEVFLEVNFFKANIAVCLNINNDTVLRCGQKISRSHTKVSVPVGKDTLGRVFSAVGEPLDLSKFAGRDIDQKTVNEATVMLMTEITRLLADLRGEKPPAELWDPSKHQQSETGRF